MHVGLLHGLKQADGSANIVLVVAQRFGDRFADSFETSQVNDGIYLVRGQERCDGLGLGQIEFSKWHVGVGNRRNSIEHSWRAVRKIVETNDPMSVLG